LRAHGTIEARMIATIGIRPGTDAEIEPARELAQAAYRVYIPRMGKPPGPMLDDYALRQRLGQLYAAAIGEEIVGIAVIVRAADHIHLDNVAVHPRWQGRGIGRALVAFAEDMARTLGLPEIRLYTHVTMTKNVALYARLGFEETHRGVEDGYERVFMRKTIVVPAG
jgi:ribosomal protein S18 acetylase RimI-like enzyme